MMDKPPSAREPPRDGHGFTGGLAVAIVTDNRDPEETARVQVRMPDLPDEQFWARLAVPMALMAAQALASSDSDHPARTRRRLVRSAQPTGVSRMARSPTLLKTGAMARSAKPVSMASDRVGASAVTRRRERDRMIPSPT